MANTHVEKYEIIVVDNASVECSPDLFLEKFPSIILVKSEVNLGFSKGNNLGLKYAKGTFILLLNSDTELKNDAISLAVAKLRDNRDVGVVSVKLMYPTGEVQRASGSFPSIKKELYEMLRLQKFLSKESAEKNLGGFFFDHEKEMVVDWVWGAFFLLKREIIEKLPGCKLPDNYFMYFEDVEWCYWIGKLGYKVLYYPRGEVIHYCGSSDSGGRIIKTKVIPNEFDFFKKNKGVLYAYLLFLARALKYLTLKEKGHLSRAKIYWDFLFNRKKYQGVK